MALDMLHAGAVDDGSPAGMVTTGGTGSILHSMLAYREQARAVRRYGAAVVVMALRV